MANPVKAEPARLLTMTQQEYDLNLPGITLQKSPEWRKEADRQIAYRKEIEAQRQLNGDLQAALASEAQHAEDARRIAGDHHEARVADEILAAVLSRVLEKNPAPWRTKTNHPFGPWHDHDTRIIDANGNEVSGNWKEVCLRAALFVRLVNTVAPPPVPSPGEQR